MKTALLSAALLIAAHAPTQAATFTDFSGDFDISRWTIALEGGAIDIAGAPTRLVFTSGDLDQGASLQHLSIRPSVGGIVSFDWAFDTLDNSPVFDPFGYTVNGVFHQVSRDDSPDNAHSGSSSFGVAQGDRFGFAAYSFDSNYGASTTTVSAFSFLEVPAPVPEPAQAALLCAGLGVLALLARRRRSAEQA